MSTGADGVRHAVAMGRMTRLVTTALGAAAAAGAAVGVARGLDGHGVDADDLDAPLPGDELHDPDAIVRTRGITIDATPADVWPWLVQLGWGRAGWYSIDALERVLGVARSVGSDGTESWRSLDEIAPQHQDLAVGDTIPLKEDVGFEVVALAPEQHLVGLFDAAGLRMVWAFVLRDDGDVTRLLVRTGFGGSNAAVRAARRLLLDPGHAVMEVVQLRRIKERAEGHLGGAT